MGRLVTGPSRRPCGATFRGALLLGDGASQRGPTKRPQQSTGDGRRHDCETHDRHNAATTTTGPTRAHAPTTTAALTTTTTRPPGLPAPSPVPLVVQPALAGEGDWQPTGPLVHGMPAMYVAQFRADDIYTSQITSAVWIDPKLLRLQLVPGSTEPGGTWATRRM